MFPIWNHVCFISSTNGFTSILDNDIYFTVPAPGPFERRVYLNPLNNNDEIIKNKFKK